MRQLVLDDPSDASAWFLLGRELAAAARHDEAADAFKGALRAQPDYAAAFRQLGNALEALGRVDEAITVYAEGVAVAERTHDLQAGKEMSAFLKRIARG